MRRMSIFIVLVALAVVVSSGCRRRSRGTQVVTETETITVMTPAPPSPTPVRPANGIVGILTGDDDSQVTDATEDMVYSAIQRGESDNPIDF